MGFHEWNWVDDIRANRINIGLGEAVREARNLTCRLYRKYPRNFVFALDRQHLDRNCAPAGQQTPLRSENEYEGGRCATNYRIRVEIPNVQVWTALTGVDTLVNAAAFLWFGDPVDSDNVFAGPIGAINTLTTGVFPPSSGDPPDRTGFGSQFKVIVGFDNGTFSTKTMRLRTLSDGGGSTISVSSRTYLVIPNIVKNIQVFRLDGNPDNCGNIPELPPSASIDNDDFGSPIYINNNYGDDPDSIVTNNNITLLNNKLELSFPMKFILNNNFEFNLEPDGVNFGDDIQNDIDNINNNLGDITNNVENIQNQIDNIDNSITELQPPESPDNGDYDIEEIDEPEAEEENSEATFVVVDIVQEPREGKTILQSVQSNNTYFAGYFYLLIDGFRQLEVPIRKQSQIFEITKPANGWGYYSVNGATLRAFTYTKV